MSLMNRMKKFKEFCRNILVFRYNMSFTDLPLSGIGEIFPEVMMTINDVPKNVSLKSNSTNNYNFIAFKY